MASRGKIDQGTLREWEDATPKGPLPNRVKDATARGMDDALARFGLRLAGEELRLKIPERTFHGFDAAVKSEDRRGHAERAKRANQFGDRRSSEDLASMLRSLDDLPGPESATASRDPLDRTTNWGPPSNMAAGDAGGRLGLGPSAFGGV